MENLFHFLENQVLFAPLAMIFMEEAGIPLPLTDLIIIYIGYQISRGHISYWWAYAIVMIADLLGASFLYFLASKYGHKLIFKVKKYIDLDTNKLNKFEHLVKKYGPFSIIIGRHLPGFKVPTTAFSGLSKVPFITFLFSTFLSMIFWVPLYLSIGQKLGPRTVHLFRTHTSMFILFSIVALCACIIPFIFLRRNPAQKQ
jgi:membrane protein DedA with SNARE-associated domain